MSNSENTQNFSKNSLTISWFSFHRLTESSLFVVPFGSLYLFLLLDSLYLTFTLDVITWLDCFLPSIKPSFQSQVGSELIINRKSALNLFGGLRVFANFDVILCKWRVLPGVANRAIIKPILLDDATTSSISYIISAISSILLDLSSFSGTAHYFFEFLTILYICSGYIDRTILRKNSFSGSWLFRYSGMNIDMYSSIFSFSYIFLTENSS